jgi:hypothetical protein
MHKRKLVAQKEERKRKSGISTNSKMESDHINYFLSQHGSGLSDIGSPYKMKRIVQQGYGIPVLVQECQGIGTLFQSLYHLMRPLIVSGLSAIKSEASVAGKKKQRYTPV